MRYLFLLLLCSSTAWAGVEVGIGDTFMRAQQDGVYYQNGFPHRLNMHSPAVDLAYANYVLPWMRYRVGYQYLGRVTSNAWVVNSDWAYGAYGAGAMQHVAGLKMYNMTGVGTVQELYVTLAPEYKFEDYAFFIEAGPTLYKPTWKVTWIQQGQVFNYAWHNSQIEVGVMASIGVRYNHTSLVLTMQPWIKTHGDEYPALYNGRATTLWLKQEF